MRTRARPGVDEVARAGDRPGAAEEGELHAPIVTHGPAARAAVPRCRRDARRSARGRRGRLPRGPRRARPARRRPGDRRARRPDEVAALEAAAAAASAAVREALDAFAAADADALGPEDRRALAAMRAGLDAARRVRAARRPAEPAADCADEAAWREAIRAGGAALRDRLEACYAAAAGRPRRSTARPLTRLQVLDRLGTEPDPARAPRAVPRARAAVAGGRTATTATGRRTARSSRTSRRPGGPRHASGSTDAALGVTRDDIEGWSPTILGAWRAAVVEPARGAASRRSSRGTGGGGRAPPSGRSARSRSTRPSTINRGVYASLGRGRRRARHPVRPPAAARAPAGAGRVHHVRGPAPPARGRRLDPGRADRARRR